MHKSNLESLIKYKIEEYKDLWAKNYIALKIEREKEKPDQKILDAGEFNMEDCQKQVAWYENLLKEESATAEPIQ